MKTRSGISYMPVFITLLAGVLITGCAKSVELAMHDIDQPVVLNKMIGMNTSLPTNAHQLPEVSGISNYEYTQTTLEAMIPPPFDQIVSSFNTPSKFSNTEARIFTVLGNSPNKCVTDLGISIESTKTAAVGFAKESAEIGFFGQGYDLAPALKKDGGDKP